MNSSERGILIIAILVVCGLALTLTSPSCEAQVQQVRCINILDGETIQIFNQQQCPPGWAPV